MTEKEKRTLYENIRNDIDCGTFILIPQYINKLLVKYTKVYRRKLRRIKRVMLKEEITKLRDNYNQFKAVAEPEIERLKKENAELECQKNRNKFCYSCVNATERCFRNEIGCPCEKYKSWKEENTKLKEEWQEQVQKANDEGYARTLQTMLLTKAKEIIKKYLSIGVGGKITQNYLDVTKQAEQFLNEVNNALS